MCDQTIHCCCCCCYISRYDVANCYKKAYRSKPMKKKIQCKDEEEKKHAKILQITFLAGNINWLFNFLFGVWAMTERSFTNWSIILPASIALPIFDCFDFVFHSISLIVFVRECILRHAIDWQYGKSLILHQLSFYIFFPKQSFNLMFIFSSKSNNSNNFVFVIINMRSTHWNRNICQI